MAELAPDLAQYLDAATTANDPSWLRESIVALRTTLDRPLTAAQYEAIAAALREPPPAQING